MKLSDIYNSPIISETNELYLLEKHINENIYFNNIPWDYSNPENNQQRIILKKHLSVSHDYRRGVEIFSVYFDNKPIMIGMNAGRELNDSIQTFITNEEGYSDMIDFLIELTKEKPTPKIFDINTHLKELESFYGDKLSEDFNVEDINPSFKVGDEIIVSEIKETINGEEVIYKNLKGLILFVDSKSYFKTYQVKLLDYKLYPFFEDRRPAFHIVPNIEEYRFYKDKEINEEALILCSKEDESFFKPLNLTGN